MYIHRAHWLAALAALVAGCGWEQGMNGVVRAAPERCADLAAEIAPVGPPLARAKVSLLCPGLAAPVITAETDPFGYFSNASSRIAPMPLTCSLRVERAGYAPRDYALADVCTVRHFRDPNATTCDLVALAAALDRVQEAR